MAKQGEEKDKKKVKRPQALKRDIQATKTRLRNRSFRAEVRTAIRHFDETLAKGDKSVSQKSLNEAYSIMDKGVKKGVYKMNTAGRTKARLAARFHAGINA